MAPTGTVEKLNGRHKAVRRALDCRDTRKLAGPGFEGRRTEGQKKCPQTDSMNLPDSNQLVLAGVTKAHEAIDTQLAGIEQHEPESQFSGSGRVLLGDRRSVNEVIVPFDGGRSPHPDGARNRWWRS